jgi:hypothetical protein
MKALTLSQPWATAIALGEKRIETRKWRPKEHPPSIVIASSNKVMSVAQREVARRVVPEEAIPAEFPRRSLLAVVKVEAFTPTGELRGTLSDQEFSLGDYSDGRWAWRFGRVSVLPEPIELYPVVSDAPCVAVTHDELDCSRLPNKDRCKNCKRRLPGALGLWDLPEVFRVKVADALSEADPAWEWA